MVVSLPVRRFSVFYMASLLVFFLPLSTTADEIRTIWIDVLDTNVNKQQGHPFSLNWFYKLKENKKFLSSEIQFSQFGDQSLIEIAGRFNGDKNYSKYDQAKNMSFSVFGKNNVTLIVHSGKTGHYTYCCEVTWKTTNNVYKFKKCSTVFIYDLPHITHHTPHVSCKQGDSIKLECNATGFPAPAVQWIRHDTHRRHVLENSSVAVVNITGKKSGGKYCCEANNRFGRKRACTSVNVEEYKPEDTTIYVKRTYKDNACLLHVECKAIASPRPTEFLMTMDDQEYNSSDGIQNYEVRLPRKEKAISCIPYNEYGHGPKENITVLVYARPSFIRTMRLQYNMTIDAVTIKCSAIGNPSPAIWWTSGDTGEIVSTNANYEIPFIMCASKKMEFFCHAENQEGKISSPKIIVNVMTQHNCTTTRDDNGGLDQSTMKAMDIALVFSLVFSMAVVVMVVIAWTYIKKRKIFRTRKGKTEMEENTYQEPIDSLATQTQLIDRRTERNPNEDDYASVEEFRHTVSIPTSTNKADPQVGKHEPIYESLLVRESVPQAI